MPTEFPERRPRALNRWLIAGMVMGYVAVTGAMLWIAVQRASLTEPAPIGTEPSAQSDAQSPPLAE